MTPEEGFYPISQGPDRLDIVLAFARYGERPRDMLSFVPDTGATIYFVSKDSFVFRDPMKPDVSKLMDVMFDIAVSGIQHADDTGTQWNIEGQLVRAQPVPHFLRDHGVRRAGRVHIMYNTGKRQGVLRILVS